MKNWTGHSKSLSKILSSSNNSDSEREVNDYYATPEFATVALLELENFRNVLEPACGEGHISSVLIENGIDVRSVDLIDRGFGEVCNFFDFREWSGDIITNPPYKYAKEFVEHSLKITPIGSKIAMFMKIQFLESKSRRSLHDNHPPKTVYVSTNRIMCGKNGHWENKDSSAACYCWFVYENGFMGVPQIKWFN